MARGNHQRPMPPFAHGATAIIPVLIGVAPFAMVAGLAGSQNGLSTLQTAAFSLFAYAGASQIAASQLLGSGASIVVAIATATTINLRFLIYSASLAPHFADAPLRQRTLASYLLVDHAVALSLSEFEQLSEQRSKIAFYLGSCLSFWITWQCFSLAGSLLGGLPALGILSFSVPLSFLGLLAPQLRQHPKAVAAAVAAVIALVAHQAPANTGLLAATAGGLGAGVLVLRSKGERETLR